MSKANYPRLDVDQLASVIQESIKKQQGKGVGPASENGSSDPHVPAPPTFKLQPDFHPKSSSDAYELHDLLRFHDRVFIENAYRAILRRYPSESEYSSSLTNLRSGRTNKIDVLAMLRFSPEGNAKGIKINGLRSRAFFRRAGRVPLVGYVVRLIIALMRLPNLIRDQREFDSYLLVQNQEIANFVNNVNTQTAGVGKQIADAQAELEEIQRAMAERHDDYDGRMTTLAKEVEAARRAIEVQGQEIETHGREIETHGREIETQGREWTQRFEHSQAELRREFESTIMTAIRQVRGELMELISERLEAKQSEVDKLAVELHRLHEVLQLVRAEITIQKTTTPLAGSGLQPTDAVNDDSAVQLDGFYAALENRFRGAPADIKDQFRFYLTYIHQACDVPNASVLDLGSGRGEWLQLLRDENVSARGVDTNKILQARCRELGLSVVEQDMLSYLKTVASNSIAAVTGFHIIEHLEFSYLVRLLDETMRVLRPGGVVLFETPNPENVLVGSNFFYFDPSHRHPLPSQLMELLLETRGFDRIEVKNLHPWESGRVDNKGALAERFNGLLYGPMDYAIVGWKLDA